MINKKTAREAWNCYREIEAGQKLLADLGEKIKDNPRHKYEHRLEDAFGHGQDLQLGIPMGNGSHRLFGLSPLLALSVIRAHIANKEKELVELNERVRIEVGMTDGPPQSLGHFSTSLGVGQQVSPSPDNERTE